MIQNRDDYASLLSLRSANGGGEHSFSWINMAELRDCFELNASTDAKYRPARHLLYMRNARWNVAGN